VSRCLPNTNDIITAFTLSVNNNFHFFIFIFSLFLKSFYFYLIYSLFTAAAQEFPSPGADPPVS
jgi:hypothetical protein